MIDWLIITWLTTVISLEFSIPGLIFDISWINFPKFCSELLFRSQKLMISIFWLEHSNPTKNLISINGFLQFNLINPEFICTASWPPVDCDSRFNWIFSLEPKNFNLPADSVYSGLFYAQASDEWMKMDPSLFKGLVSIDAPI